MTPTPLTSTNSDTITTPSGSGVTPGGEQPERADAGDGDADGERAVHAPPLGGPAGEEAEDHEPGGVEPERERVPLRRESVDALQHVGRAGEVGEQGGVQEALVEHRAEEDPVGRAAPGSRGRSGAKPPRVRRSSGSVSRNSEQACEQDPGADRREEEEQAPPVGDGGELPAEQRTDDRGEAAEHGQPPVEADQRAAGVQVAAGGLGDHDADAAGQPLHEPGDDQHLDGRADRAQHRGDHVGDDPDQQDAAATEPVRQRARRSAARGRARSGMR